MVLTNLDRELGIFAVSVGYFVDPRFLFRPLEVVVDLDQVQLVGQLVRVAWNSTW